jgi:nucleotide-binding universal stress UspA family protein
LFATQVYIYHVVLYEEVVPSFGLDEGAALHVPMIDTKALLAERSRALPQFMASNFKDIMANLRVRQEADMGIVSDKILEKANTIGANFMCTHGWTGIGHMLIGSITEQVVRNSCCPVLSIRPST